MFSQFLDALVFARELFREAFLVHENRSLGANLDYVWVRGVVLPTDDDKVMRYERSLTAHHPSVRVITYSTSLLDSIAIERSGFKGMRLLVPEASLIGSTLRDDAAFQHKDTDVVIDPFLHLSAPLYPGSLADQYVDYLWMSCDTNKEWHRLNEIAEHRMHHIAANSEELMHAAVTKVLFGAAAYKFKKLEARRALSSTEEAG
jgi:hypothetical protein